MEYLKTFENYDMKQPEQLMDIVGDKDVNTNRQIQYAVYFEPDGTFGAITNARTWLKKQGDYVIGSMYYDKPIGFKKGTGYIAKWKGISPSEWKDLDGILVSDDFKEGGVKILFFVFPE